MNLAVEYIKYRWNAKGRHGTHSPFVYDFVDNCLKIKLSDSFKSKLNSLIIDLQGQNRVITIKDFGAGSKKLGNKRSISQILKNSSSNGKYSSLLYKICAHYKPENILEFGTSLGFGSIHMSYGNPISSITTIEGCTETRAEALKNFDIMDCNNVTSIEQKFSEFLQEYKGNPFNLVFIDGHHDGTALKEYLNQLEPLTNDETIFILDDIRWSNSMFDAWNDIINSSEYNVTIDLFRMGIILKRQTQMKEHFVIKL